MIVGRSWVDRDRELDGYPVRDLNWYFAALLRVYNERMMKHLHMNARYALAAAAAAVALVVAVTLIAVTATTALAGAPTLTAATAPAHAETATLARATTPVATLTATPAAYGAQATFENPSLSVTAQVQTTGAAHVVEHRAFAFGGQFDVLRWPFTGLPEDAEITVAQVRAAQTDDAGNIAGDWTVLTPTSFSSDWRQAVEGAGGNLAEQLRDATADGEPPLPAPNTWALDERQRALYVFFQQTSAHMLFEVDYTVANAVAAFDDVAEMYWDYVPARDDVLTRDVTATVQLPVPEGTAVTPGETVLAWGHGAAGQFDIGADGTITFTVPEVPAGQYANAHVLFPAEWLPNLTVEAKQAHSGTRADDARAEEEAWTDTYTSRIVNELGLNIAALAICALALLAADIAYLALGREPRRDQLPALGADEVRHVVHDPEMLARFLHWGHVAPTEPDPAAVTARLHAAALFDLRSFRAQKVLAVTALAFLVLAVAAALAFRGWLAAGAFLATGLAIGVVANYLPRRTPKGVALALALDADEPATHEDACIGTPTGPHTSATPDPKGAA